MTGETTPIFSFSPVVTMEIGVTSEPVPAVVGARISGNRGPLALPTPNTSASCSRAGREQRDELGGIERGAAAEPEHAGRAERRGRLDRLPDHRRRRIGDDIGEDRGLDAGARERFQRPRDDAGGDHAGDR